MPFRSDKIKIPTVDSSENRNIEDVVGNKSDTKSGDSLISLTKGIDKESVNGLAGVSNSLSYRVHEIERHFHGREKWFGVAASPSGETHVADRMAGGISAFQLISGNDTFGAWVQILGSSDTPVSAGMDYFDAHRYMVTTTDSTNPFIVQIIAGESSGFVAKLAAEEFTEIAYISATNSNDSGIEEIMSSRITTGTKVWARCACIGANAKVINFYFGIHEYEG